MKHRLLGRTGLKVSEIGFGAWAIGGGMWGHADDKVSLDALRRALDLGVNFVDTAAVYGRGRSEQLIGKVHRERSGRFHIATKVPPKNWSWPPPPGCPLRDAFPADWVRSETEKSLRQLRLDCVDIQQIHVWSPNWVRENEWYEALLKLKREGKIRFIGVSLNDLRPDEALELVRSGMADTVQVIYNIFEQAPADRLFALCREHNVGVIDRVPLDEGALTGKLTADSKFDDWRKDYFTPEVLAETVRRVERLRFLVRPGVPSLAAAALKFCLSHPDVSTVIPGIRTPAQAEDNCVASESPALTAEELDALRAHRWDRD